MIIFNLHHHCHGRWLLHYHPGGGRGGGGYGGGQSGKSDFDGGDGDGGGGDGGGGASEEIFSNFKCSV